MDQVPILLCEYCAAPAVILGDHEQLCDKCYTLYVLEA